MANGRAAATAGTTTLAPPAAPGHSPIARAVRWARVHLFSTWLSTAVTLVLFYLVMRMGVSLINWGFVNAIWSLPDAAAGGADTRICREARAESACWALITERYRFILFGTYPYLEQWRGAVVIALFLALYGVSAMRQFWNIKLVGIWVAGLAAIAVFMWGGIFGLTYVEQEKWGGLPLTLILATFGIAFAFPLSILVALGRRSEMPAIRYICVAYIELIRGVPLISVLFMASVMFPLFLPEGITIDKLLRAQVAIIMFTAAYLAEVVRGGLQAIPKGQYEAADAIGLGYWKKMGLIVLPQALRICIPPMVGSFIGLFKDTSLVTIIGLYDLLGAAKASIVEPRWVGFGVEAYIFISTIYFVFCFAMSKYSQNLEAEFSKHTKR
jgi:general L-amino acid transport system permease protein